MIDRLSSGQSSLDEILGGGLPTPAITLIAGAPGTGKTMLAEQYVFHNATIERPAVYLATTSEPLDKLVRYGQELSFFDPSKVGSAVLYNTLHEALTTGGLQAALEQVIELLRDVRPGIIVFDTIKAFRTFSPDGNTHREFISELAGRLSAAPVSTFWVGEYNVEDLPDSIEAAVADAIITLTTIHAGQRTLRELRVDKLRGSSSLSGAHAYRLSEHGLTAFPRLADPVDDGAARPSAERVSLGSPELDRLFGGGVWSGTTTIVVGPSGIGKTMLGLDFLAAGARAGKRSVFATLQEPLSQLTRVIERSDWMGIRDLIEIHRRSPVDMYIDEWVYDTLATVERTGADLLLIDSLSDLRIASPDETRFEEYVYSLGQRSTRNGTTILMTLETRPPFAFAGTIGSALSHIADNILLIGYHVDGSDVRRAIHVLKSRGSAHDQAIYEFTIAADGIHIGDPIRLDLGLPPRADAVSRTA
ncbi:MAG TPA: ATPase domain-containing protein [Candidatus Limnocylindrales bacterium]|nr:ATPase domain-containing protein [Candidatus Limnocylindrales bacterium]